MPLYRYVKAPIGIDSTIPPAKSRRRLPRRISKLIPPTLITLGSILVANVAWPILSYQLFTAPSLQKTEFIAPVSQSQLGSNPFISPQKPSDTTTPQVLGANLDYTNARNWFPTAEFQSSSTTVNQYSIDIPSLDITAAQVIVGNDDLNQALIHYPGTADPGGYGSPVIFGHSVLRQFYNPDIDNSNRYVSIFSKIMTLKNSDRIFVDYDGIRYTYEVKDKVEVEPDDLFILEQKYHGRDLKLITCVPEGTYLRRGVVIARLVDVSGETTSQ